mmetsp:Transcript_23603/g.74438  ORF Transcript_23603/g.74438 Transcript_23603/m.74438 type:complete len:523 (-) Transcript_23603:183-1751(-)
MQPNSGPSPVAAPAPAPRGGAAPAPSRAASSGGRSSTKPGLCLPASPLPKSESRDNRGGDGGRSVTCASCAGSPLNLSKCFSSAFIVPQEYPHLQPISLVGPVSLGGSRDPRASPPPARLPATPGPPGPPRPPRPPNMPGGMPPSSPMSASSIAGSFGSMPPSIASSPTKSSASMPGARSPRPPRRPSSPPPLPPILLPLPPRPRPKLPPRPPPRLPPRPPPRPPRPPRPGESPKPPMAARSSMSRSPRLPRSPNMPCICSIAAASSSSSSLILSILSRNLARSLALLSASSSASSGLTPRILAISLASGMYSGTCWTSRVDGSPQATAGPLASGGAPASFLYISMTASASLALSTFCCMCARMSGTPFTFDMSAVVPSGRTKVPEESPMPVTCFMKDSKDAFMLLMVSLAHSSHSTPCFCSKCANINRLVEAVCWHMVQRTFLPFDFTCSSINCDILSWLSVQGRTSCIMSSTMPPSSIISPTHMFMNWSMSKSSRSMSPDLSYLRRFFSSDRMENASAIF